MTDDWLDTSHNICFEFCYRICTNCMLLFFKQVKRALEETFEKDWAFRITRPKRYKLLLKKLKKRSSFKKNSKKIFVWVSGCSFEEKRTNCYCFYVCSLAEQEMKTNRLDKRFVGPAEHTLGRQRRSNSFRIANPTSTLRRKLPFLRDPLGGLSSPLPRSR